jgi:hypothetical protein
MEHIEQSVISVTLIAEEQRLEFLPRLVFGKYLLIFERQPKDGNGRY